MKKGIMKLMVTLAAFAAIGICFSGNASAEIKFWVLPRLSAVELHAMFNPLADYLSAELGEKVTIVVPKDFDAFKAGVKAGQADLAFANSLIYVQVKRDVKVEPLAVSAEPKAGTKFRGIIIARKDSGIQKIQDLRGKRLVFVEKDSAAGYVFQMLLLNRAGLDVQKDFTTLPFAKKHDNVVMAVLNKAADAGGIREDDLEKLRGKVDIDQLKIVGFTDYFPNWPVFASSRIAPETTAKIRSALLKLKPNDANAEKVLKAAKLAGFASISDKDYDELRKAAHLAGAF